MLSSYNGRSVYACKFMGTRLNMNDTTFSLCHEAQVGDQILGPIEELSIKNYEIAVTRIIERNFSEDAPCRKCDKCRKTVFKKEQINYVPISISGYCNSSCIYCGGHFGKEGQGYDPIPFLMELERENAFAPGCYFDWGGGEPTLAPHFEETVHWIAEHGYSQRINTNAILYSPAAELALKEGRASLRISVDSGSEKCFYRMKGHKKYKDVWESIARYRKAGSNVYVKYNICNYNSDLKEIDLFLENCAGAGINHILIDAEISAYQPRKNAGPFYFTRKEFDTAHYMEKRAVEMGFDVEISAYAYSVRGEYDEYGKLKLPSKYFDNIDWGVISSGIFAETFPNIEYMAETIKGMDDAKDVIIWGAGYAGKKIAARLKGLGISISGIIDKNSNLWGKVIGDVLISSPEDLFCQKRECFLILASQSAEEMLKMVNDEDYKGATVYWMKYV